MKQFYEKESSISEAKIEIARCRAMLELIKNNDLAAEIEINGVRIGLCNNIKLKPVIEHQIKEAEKFLEGKENMWE